MNALDDLQAVMFEWKKQTSVIKTTLIRRANGPNYWYRLQFIDQSDPESSRGWYNQKFEDCIQWAEEKLKDWPDCDRKAFDVWDFKQRQSAEKFLTVFHLSWNQ